MAHDDPLPGIKTHGVPGWKQGCRCFECRRAHNEDMRQYRARVKANGGNPPARKKTVRVPAGAGVVETRIRNQFGQMGLEGNLEAQTLMDLAYINARLIDDIEDSGRWHLLSTAQKVLLDVMDRLRKLQAPGAAGGSAGAGDEPEGVDDFVAGLSKQPGRG